MIQRVTLVKRRTEDGLVELQDDVILGKSYLIREETIRIAHGYNLIKDKKWSRMIVDVIDVDGKTTGWFPTELLQIDGLPYRIPFV